MIKVFVEVDWVQIDDRESEIKALRFETAALRHESTFMRSEIDELKSLVKRFADEYAQE